MSLVPGKSLLHYGCRGIGKTMMMSQLLAHHGRNDNLMVIDSGSVFIIDAPFRQFPEAHNPLHTPLQRMGEGVKRARCRLGTRGNWIFAHLYCELRKMGATCNLVSAQFQQQQALPGKAHRDRSRHPHKLKWTSAAFLETPYGVIDCNGGTWATLELAIAHLSNGKAKSFRKQQASEDIVNKSHQSALAYMNHNIFWQKYLIHEVRDELTLAWLEASTPNINFDPPVRRL